ncbi:ABC transporter ATP-binding protein [Phytobacter sp. V91]|uniref:ABC transporter ATP-binding protein n=1 Tax=Phytobacter sp. V91 TaxID=3369425 RepID=UPI003F63C011
MLSVEGLGTRAFRDLGCYVSEGSCTAITGPSGSGKTTLLNAIAGTVPYTGTIRFAGKSINGLPPWRRPCRYLNQRLYLFPYLTVAGNLGLAQYAAGLPGSKSAQMAMLEEMGIAHLAHCYPRQISGGEQQRAALARAMVSHPRLLLLDEPFSSLDWDIRRHLWTVVKNLRQHDVTILLVTHEPLEVEALADTQWAFGEDGLREQQI